MKEELPPEKLEPEWARALTEALSENAKAKSKRPRLRKLWLFIGGLAVVAGLAATLIQLVQWANARPSTVASLVMETGDF